MNFFVLEKEMLEILKLLLEKEVMILILFICGEKFGYILDDDFVVIEVVFFDLVIGMIFGVGYWVYVEVLEVFVNCVFSFLFC